MRTLIELCDGLPEQSFQADDILIPEGGATGRLYVLIEGSVQVVKGGIPIFESSDPGAVFGEISALLDIPHTATVKTQAPSRCYVISEASAFLRTHQELAFGLSKVMAQRLYAMTSYLADIKRQFGDHGSHLSILDQVLTSLMHYHHNDPFEAGSDRYPDPTL